MKTTLWMVSLCASILLLSACGGSDYSLPASGTANNYISGGGGGSPPAANWQMTENALVTAGLVEQQPTQFDTFNSYIGLAHLGLNTVTRGYEFTTPANAAFSFSVIARELSNTGAVTIRLGNSAGPNPESLLAAGMLIDAPELAQAGGMWQCLGDGVVNMTVRGKISSDQVLVFETTTSAGSEVIAIRVKIGSYSGISMGGVISPGANVVSRTTVYSSDDDGFGLPAVAVSGDRYSITAYDGDYAQGRTRAWLQFDAQTSSVTGGEGTSVSPDSGTWRDQEISAQNNVLAVAYTGNNQVQVEVSLDRGANFGSPVVLNEATSASVGSQRLVQIEIAPDYTLAVAYWRMLSNGSVHTSELCVAEATPTGFDSNNTPIGYAFGTPWIVRSINSAVVPVVMDIEYSSGGDLVIGYAYNMFTWGTMSLQCRCATRLATGASYDFLIDSENQTWGTDPSVSIIGSGVNMRIFYAYEFSVGVRVVELRNFGATPISGSNAATIGRAGAYSPSVHARMQNGQLRLDLLYLAPADLGSSLCRMHFDDWDGSSGFTSDELFSSTTQAGGTPMGFYPGMLVNTVGFMGFDAVTDGDDIAVVLHTEEIDLYEGVIPTQPGVATPPLASPTYYGTGTVVLLPGMTGTVSAPDASDANQLELIVLD